jgi:outer membrane murein-binding lipoprotein Lpp
VAVDTRLLRAAPNMTGGARRQHRSTVFDSCRVHHTPYTLLPLSACADSSILKLLLLSYVKFGQVWPAKSCRRANVRPDAVYFSASQRGSRMNKSIVVKLAAVAMVVGLAGCEDLKPLQAEVDTLKTQVGQLRTDVDAAKASADAASRAASAAQSTATQAASAASSAQSTANQALSAAQAAQASCDATNEKIDRMFKKSVSK